MYVGSSELLLALVALAASPAKAWSPTDGYAPGNVTCDDDIVLVRNASHTLSEEEQDWLEARDPKAKEALRSFMQRAMANFSDTSLLDALFSDDSSNVPKIGIGCSGGGYRAMLSGAGMIAAMDNRTVGADEHGLGGLLQGATYLAGLSGGNWLTGTLAWNNWTPVQDILYGFYNDTDDAIWDISHSILASGGINIFSTASRWDHISDAVKAKEDAGFNTSLTDVWGRALSYNFFPTLYRGGVGYTWATLQEADVFKNGDMPFPISVADGRYPGTTIIDLNATVFEVNPFELGSWDPTLNAFTNVKYLGTNVSNGRPVNPGQCVAGFDNTGFIMGTSSSLFNQFLLHINSTSMPTFIRRMLTHFLNDLAEDYDDIAIYEPNPFKNTNYVVSNYSHSIVDSEYLFLVDGGEDNENIPLVPLVQKQRDLDVVFALDNSADTDEYWPDGSSLVHTYRRQFGMQGLGLAFPYVPGQDTFVNLGLNRRPTFFGCDATNLTNLEYIPPLVVYIPNSRHSFNGNQSTFKLSYSKSERIGMIQNGFEAATMANFTQDPEFLGCIGCAILRRKQQSLNYTLPAECEQCFSNYCWNGTVDDTPVSGLGGLFAQDSSSLASGLDSSATAEAVSGSESSSTSASSTSASSSKHKDGAVALNTSGSIFFGILSIILGFF